MDLFKIIISTIKKNLGLFAILTLLAISGGIVHYFVQSLSYISNFKTNNGDVDYTLFKSLTDFTQISEAVYDLPQEELDAINKRLLDFKVSFVEETATSISFTAVSKLEDADHNALQNDVLRLINNNKFIKNSQKNELHVLGEKLIFIKEKIAQLDSLMINPSINAHISEIPSDSYHLYSQQLDLEERIDLMGKFQLIKPVTEIKTNKKPVILFVLLYLILGGFMFMLLFKREKAEA